MLAETESVQSFTATATTPLSSCEPKPLLKALTLLSPFTNSRSSLPILSYCLLSGDTVTVNDLENEISLTVEGLQVEGVILVPLKALKNALPAKADRKVSLKVEIVDGCEFLVVDGNVRIYMHDVKEWPMTGDLGETQGLPFTFLSNVLGQVASARSNDSSRPSLCGVLLSPKQGFIAASNGHFALKAGMRQDGEFERIVSGDLVPLLAKLPDLVCQFYETQPDPEDPQRALVQRVVFFNDTTLIVTRPIDQEFPELDGVFKKDGHVKVELNKTALVDALTACRKFTTECSRGVRLDLKPHSLTLTVIHPDTGEIQQSVPVKTSLTVTFGLNVDYLLTVLKTQPDNVTFYVAVNDQKGEVEVPIFFLDSGIDAAIMVMRIF